MIGRRQKGERTEEGLVEEEEEKEEDKRIRRPLIHWIPQVKNLEEAGHAAGMAVQQELEAAKQQLSEAEEAKRLHENSMTSLKKQLDDQILATKVKLLPLLPLLPSSPPSSPLLSSPIYPSLPLHFPALLLNEL